MALLTFDSFDHYATADLAKKGWVSGGGAFWTILAGHGRTGAAGLCSYRSFNVVGSNPPNAAQPGNINNTIVTTGISKSVSPSGALIIGFALKAGSFGSSGSRVFTLGSFAIDVSATGLLSVTNFSATHQLVGNSYSYIELKIPFGTVGVGGAELRVDGQPFAVSSVGYTQAAITSIRFGYTTTNAQLSYVIDDFYVCDTTGAAPWNDFLGDVRADYLQPTSDGNYSQFTPSTAGPHYVLVDDSAPNTTDYVDGTAVNQRDSFGFADLTALASSTVYAVQVNAAIQKDDAGSRSASTMIRTGGTDADGASVVLSTSQAYISQIYPTDASGSTWTQSSVNAMEAGIKVTV